MQSYGSALSRSQPFQTPSPPSEQLWPRLHGVHYPGHPTPLQPLPRSSNQSRTKWNDQKIRQRPAFFPAGDLGYAETKRHFPPEILKPNQNMRERAWWDYLRGCYNAIGKIDRQNYLSDYELVPLLQAIQEDTTGIFWTPDDAMLDYDAIIRLRREDKEVVVKRKLVVHLIRFTDAGGHFAILIYDHGSKRWVFADPWSDNREARFSIASWRLHRWLVDSDLVPARVQESKIRSHGTIHRITEQRNDWTCGLIAIDFIRAFMRQGLDDWAASYNAETAEEDMIQRWSGWLRSQLGHAPNTDVRIPRVPHLSYSDFIEERWPQMKAPPPSGINAGASRDDPIITSPSPQPARLPKESTGSLKAFRKSRPPTGKSWDASIGLGNWQSRPVIPEEAIDLSMSSPMVSGNSTTHMTGRMDGHVGIPVPNANQLRSSTTVELRNTPYRHSVTPEPHMDTDRRARLSPSHPPSWQGW